jgi:hypothetical protein
MQLSIYIWTPISHVFRNPSPALIGIHKRIGYVQKAGLYIHQFTTSQHNSYFDLLLLVITTSQFVLPSSSCLQRAVDLWSNAQQLQAFVKKQSATAQRGTYAQACYQFI